MAGPVRKAVLPEVPTTDEAGLPGFHSEVWVGYFAPVGTPAEIVRTLYGEIAKAAKSADVAEAMKGSGSRFVVTRPEEFAAFLKADREKWRKVAEAANIRVE